MLLIGKTQVKVGEGNPSSSTAPSQKIHKITQPFFYGRESEISLAIRVIDEII